MTWSGQNPTDQALSTFDDVHIAIQPQETWRPLTSAENDQVSLAPARQQP